eukprot:TRINITY_DN18541_c0_g1_i4.p1 TRINITY_DN18541_c0_g1~~TRINITY_DN18541_c0_g1_i4.p1  ORF type:complete len:146 (-),score=48.34 TRINITY_DN18541_c0_g1_i4:472-909(-)
MTFSMSELNTTSKIIMEEEEEDDGPVMSLKELEEEKKKLKENQQRNDDIALVVCMVTILAFTCFVVIFKVSVIDEKPNMNISTFRPQGQMVNDNKKYNGFGYIPCNGYVPCQPEYLPADKLEERLDGAMPCHNYKEMGDSPEGCW